MGLANNHALDFGTTALRDCAPRLRREKIEPVGLATPTNNAYRPGFFFLPGDKKIALVAISDVGPAAGLQIAAASDRVRLNDAIANARSRANFVVCMVHWEIENSKNFTDEQRELARWLIDRGVDLVVGSHPHCVQPLDFYHGCPIAYSLGNLVFDGAPTVASWNHGALLEITLDGNAKVASASLIPLILEAASREWTEQRVKPPWAAPKIFQARQPLRLDILSSRATCVKIDASWLSDCQNKIIATSNESLSSILFGRPRRLH